jgi:hypothetical protein
MEIKVSIGELLDKITILGIKLDKLENGEKRDNVRKEWDYLSTKITESMKEDDQFAVLFLKLLNINRELWDIEDGKRECERKKEFGEHFIQLARQVYIKNDLRAAIKKEINIHFNSEFTEEKSYKKY